MIPKIFRLLISTGPKGKPNLKERKEKRNVLHLYRLPRGFVHPINKEDEEKEKISVANEFFVS